MKDLWNRQRTYNSTYERSMHFFNAIQERFSLKQYMARKVAIINRRACYVVYNMYSILKQKHLA